MKRLFLLVAITIVILAGTGGPSLVLLAVALLLIPILLVGLLQRLLARH